jgi:D-alanyl-lipoteichoic acid acyltransferase DltB (MBOAT superfamily)
VTGRPDPVAYLGEVARSPQGRDYKAAVLASLGFSYVFLRLLDVTRCVAEGRSPAPSLPNTVNYLVPFHMLAAGPIQSYDDFVRAPADGAPLTVSTALAATERLAWGLFKKFVLASAISHVFLTAFTVGGWYFLLEVQLFYVWLYLDFSALSDIALGLGGLLGLSTPQNFNQPYLARNVINFWERWHISLSQFIRRNLYLPMQIWLARRTDNSYPLACSSLAVLVSFGLCGLWHAIDLRFLAWGVFHAAGLIVNNLYRDFLVRRLGAKGVRAYLANPAIRIAAIAVTFEFVAFSLTVFQLPG